MSFPTRELWQAHVDKEHGGLQRYRNAFLSLASVLPYVVRSQEWRLAMSSFTEFLHAWDPTSGGEVASDGTTAASPRPTPIPYDPPPSDSPL